MSALVLQKVSKNPMGILFNLINCSKSKLTIKNANSSVFSQIPLLSYLKRLYILEIYTLQITTKFAKEEQ